MRTSRPKPSDELRRQQWQARSTFNDMSLPGSNAPRVKRLHRRVQLKHGLLPPDVAEMEIEEAEIDYAQNAITRKRPLDSPPPCFYFSECKTRAEMEKQGKAVCRACSEKLIGNIYPLRKPGESTYSGISHGHKDLRPADFRAVKIALLAR